MNNKSQLKTGILLNYINQGAGNLIPLFYTPIMLSLLGQTEYGLYKLSSNVTSYLGLASFGIGSAVTRYIIKAQIDGGKKAEEETLGTFLSLFKIVAVIAFSVGCILCFKLKDWYGGALSSSELKRMALLVFIMTCNTSIGFVMAPYYSVITAHEKFTFLECVSLLNTCILPAINLLVLFLGCASVGLAIVSLSVGVVTRACYTGFVNRQLHLRARKSGASIDKLKEILSFSFWVFVSNIVGQLYYSTDTVMIGLVPALATSGVAVYSIGALISNAVFSLSNGVSQFLIPKTNKMVLSDSKPEELTELAIKVGRIQAYMNALLMTGFAAFGRSFIYLYTKNSGGDYSEAYWVALLLMIPGSVPLLQSTCMNIIVAQNKHRFRSLMYLGIAIINVIGTWFLIHTHFGIIGAALVTGVALIIGPGLVMNWYYEKIIGLNIKLFWKKTGVVFLIPICLCAVAVFIGRFVNYTSVPAFIAGVLVYTAAFAALSWKLIMNPYEKKLLRSMAKPFGR